MVSREDVIAAYRLILGREPEDEEAVQAHMRAYQDAEQMRWAFLQSPEFQRQSPSNRWALPTDQAGFNEVEVAVEPALMAQLFARVEECWSELGREEPYWSVLSGSRFKMQNFAEHESHYQYSGELDLMRLLSWLERNGVEAGSLACCLEYGCGTGRVTRWLSSMFRRIVACDISQPHLTLAREYLEKCGCGNVEFLQVVSVEEPPLPSADLVFCVIVLQHNPPPVIAAILRRLLACLRPGGVAFFQVPTYARGYRFECAEYLRKPVLKDAFEMHVLPQRHVFSIAGEAGCDVIEVLPDNCVGDADWISNTFLVRKRQ